MVTVYMCLYVRRWKIVAFVQVKWTAMPIIVCARRRRWMLIHLFASTPAHQKLVMLRWALVWHRCSVLVDALSAASILLIGCQKGTHTLDYHSGRKTNCGIRNTKNCGILVACWINESTLNAAQNCVCPLFCAKSWDIFIIQSAVQT